MIFKTDRPDFNPGFVASLAVWPWQIYLIFPVYGFCICFDFFLNLFIYLRERVGEGTEGKEERIFQQTPC